MNFRVSKLIHFIDNFLSDIVTLSVKFHKWACNAQPTDNLDRHLVCSLCKMLNDFIEFKYQAPQWGFNP